MGQFCTLPRTNKYIALFYIRIFPCHFVILLKEKFSMWITRVICGWRMDCCVGQWVGQCNPLSTLHVLHSPAMVVYTVYSNKLYHFFNLLFSQCKYELSFCIMCTCDTACMCVCVYMSMCVYVCSHIYIYGCVLLY